MFSTVQKSQQCIEGLPFQLPTVICELFSIVNCELCTVHKSQCIEGLPCQFPLHPPLAQTHSAISIQRTFHKYCLHSVISCILFAAKKDILHTFHSIERYPAYFSLHIVISYLYLTNQKALERFFISFSFYSFTQNNVVSCLTRLVQQCICICTNIIYPILFT